MGVLSHLSDGGRPYRYDPRIVVLLACCGIVLCKSLFTLWQLALFGLVLFGTTLVTQTSLKSFFLKSLMVLPFSLAALPLIFTVVGSTWFEFGSFTATWEGLERFLLIFFHCWLCYQVLLLAASTVGPFAFVEALGRLGLPQRIVTMMSLALRYLDLLSDEAKRMNRARHCRRAGQHRTLFENATETSHLVGSLFLRTLDRVERIQSAMNCRGDGHPARPKASPPAPWLHWIGLWIFALFTVWTISVGT